MRLYFFAALAGVSVFSVGCSTLPEQRDLTHVDTLEIIERVRCETREAVLKYGKAHWINQVAIGYGYDFDATEDNALLASSTFVWPIHLGVVGLSGTAGAARQRDIDNKTNIAEVLGNLRKLDCSNAKWDESFRYPIVGRIGTGEVIDRYVAIHGMSGILPGSLVRTLKFTAKYTGGIHPSISLIPALKQAVNADVNLTADREDVHELILTLAAPAPVVLAKAAPPPGSSRSLEEGTNEEEVRPTPNEDKLRALRSLDVERSLRIQNQILDQLGPVQ